jgi:hypothetical protein
LHVGLETGERPKPRSRLKAGLKALGSWFPLVSMKTPMLPDVSTSPDVTGALGIPMEV